MTRFAPAALKAWTLGLCVLAVGACSSTAPTQTAQPATDTSAGLRGKAKPGSQEDLSVNVGDTIFFDLDSHALRADAQSVLQKQAAWLKAHPQVRLVIEGHADERGTRDYNLALGDRRAGSVREYLSSLGVDGSRLEAKSYGKERPMCAESEEECYSRNRRGFSAVSGGTGS